MSTAVEERIGMPKPKPVPAPEPSEDRVTLLNLKGSLAERAYLRAISRKTGVPLAEIARRGMAMWAVKHDQIKPPADWVENGE